jgi:hypothetical protein
MLGAEQWLNWRHNDNREDGLPAAFCQMPCKEDFRVGQRVNFVDQSLRRHVVESRSHQLTSGDGSL